MVPRRSRFSVFLAAATVALALAMSPAVVGAGPNTDTASGSGTVFSDQVDFSARSTNVNTDARGRIRVTDTGLDPNQTWTAEVTCMRVIGATATTPATVVVSGRIVDSPPGSFVQSIQVQATDAGKFANAPDSMFYQFFGTPSPPDGTCPMPITFTSPLADGEVTISNALP